MLEEVVELLGLPTRRRAPLEAPWEYTEAYARLILANGFARLGRRERAIELGDAAKQPLARVAGDRVHNLLAELFFHRLECALELRPRTKRLRPELVAALIALDRVPRYKVDRVLESSPTISVNGREGTVDAVGDWIRHRERHEPNAVVSRLDDLRTIDQPEARAALIATLLDEPESEEGITACVDAVVELPHDLAVPLLPDIAVIAPRHSPVLQAKAGFAIARFGFGELATPLLDEARAWIATLEPEFVWLVVPPLLRAMRWLGLDADTEATLGEVLRRFALNELATPFRFVVAVASGSAGDTRGTAMIDAVIEGPTELRTRLANVRMIAAAASFAEHDYGLAIHRKLFARYRDVSDGYGTNSHYCLSVLHFIESLVLGICDVELANLNVLDPASQPLLGSGFAF